MLGSLPSRNQKHVRFETSWSGTKTLAYIWVSRRLGSRLPSRTTTSPSAVRTRLHSFRSATSQQMPSEVHQLKGLMQSELAESCAGSNQALPLTTLTKRVRSPWPTVYACQAAEAPDGTSLKHKFPQSWVKPSVVSLSSLVMLHRLRKHHKTWTN